MNICLHNNVIMLMLMLMLTCANIKFYKIVVSLIEVDNKEDL